MTHDERFDRLDASIARQVELYQSTFDSLKSEMHQEIGAVKEQMKEGFDRLDARMSRMEARLDKIAAGAHYVTRLVEWSEKQDAFQADTLHRLNDLADRVKRLEGGAAA
jgi:uncharacterized coiled-coil protein SlyX